MSDPVASDPTTIKPAPRSVRSMKTDPEGCFELGSDGVMRSFDGTYARNVIDYIAYTPSQIKQFVDRFPAPWSQETEDKFRGVDGTTVGEEQCWNPQDSDRPPKWTEEEKVEATRVVEEKNREIRERVKQEEREGVDVAAKYACGRMWNDYDLTPKSTA